MGVQVLEGTISEIQHALGALPYGPEKRLRAIVTEQEGTENAAREPFRPVEFRNGVPLLPRRTIRKAWCGRAESRAKKRT